MVSLAALRRTTRAALCVDCGKCSSSCPLLGPAGFTPRRIVQESDRSATAAKEGVQRCLTCGRCEERCPEGVLFDDYVRGLRELVSTSRAPCPHAGTFQAIARSMADGPAPRRDTSWIDADLRVAETGETAVFVGCLPFFDRYFADDLDVRPMDVARSTIRLLNAAGVTPVVLEEERCCGHDLLWNGERERFLKLAERNAEAFSKRGIKNIVTACGECCRTLRLDYAEAVPTFRPKVEHSSEFVARMLEEGTLEPRAGEDVRVTYQDPCRLARHLDVVDQPRRVLEELPGTELIEMDRSGRDAICCGTSGFIHCDAESRRLQTSRLDEARATGADVLVTACPKCMIHLSCAQTEDRRQQRPTSALPVKDLTVLAASMLTGSAAAKDATPVATAALDGGESP